MNDREKLAADALEAFACGIEAAASPHIEHRSADQRAHAVATTMARSRPIRELADDLRLGKVKIVDA